MADLKVYYDADADLNVIRQQKVAIIGYGSQGHAHALNLKDSGVEVRVGLRPDSKSVEAARSAGLTVGTPDEVAEWADLVMLLVPDQHMGRIYTDEVASHLRPGKTVAFAHGFNIHFSQIQPPDGVDAIMIAPKGPGHLVRRVFTEGAGVPCLVAVAQDASGRALETALSYACAVGGTRSGVIETTFKDETETDLFGEQAVLCGGSAELIKAGFEVLVEAGYPPELAYFECLHEMKLIVDLYYEGGLKRMNFSVSDTAEYGGMTRGPRLITAETKAEMRKILGEIQTGQFAREFLADQAAGGPVMAECRKANETHILEGVGAKLRRMMAWLKPAKKAA